MNIEISTLIPGWPLANPCFSSRTVTIYNRLRDDLAVWRMLSRVFVKKVLGRTVCLFRMEKAVRPFDICRVVFVRIGQW